MNLITHLKRHHGFLKKYNAYQEYEKLTALKEARVQNLRRKPSEVENAKKILLMALMNHYQPQNYTFTFHLQ